MDFSWLQTSSKIGDDWVYPQPPCLNFGWLEVDVIPRIAFTGKNMATRRANR